MKAFSTFVFYCWSLLILGNKFHGVESTLEDMTCQFFSPRAAPGCCQRNVYVNETSIKVNYIVTRENSSEGILWGLSINITWEEVSTNGFTSFEVEWEEMVSEEDLEGNTVLIMGLTGACSRTDPPPLCSSGSRNIAIVDQPYLFASGVLFGFGYRFRIRVLEDDNPIGTSVCLDGISDPSIFTSPECYDVTGDLDFCRNQPIVASSSPVNATVVETLLEPTSGNETMLSLRLSWKQPIQVNGVVLSYSVVSKTSNGNTLRTDNILVEGNATSNTVYEFLAQNLLNDTVYGFEIVPFVKPALGSFFDASFPGNTVSISHRTFFQEPADTTTQVADTTTRTKETPPSSSPILILLIVLCIAFVFIVTCAAFLIKKILKKRRTKLKREAQSLYFKPQFTYRSSKKDEQSRRDAVAPEFKAVEIFNYDNIKEGDLLGSGQYGEVFQGEAILPGKTTWTVVAIKKPKNAISPEVIDDFKNEIRLMLELGKHPNIISVLGCCTVEEPYYLLTDYMNYGDLLHFLRKCCLEENWKVDHIYKITTINQLQIAQQIADGMNYVSHTRFFHGDLAARNILVGNGLVIKVTDFGLTDDLYQKGYTRLQSGAKRPYKWYSPESIEHQFCTLKTDIWSFGVLLWEILTFGQQTPYHGMSIAEVLYRLKDGYRMPCPDGTPEFMQKMIHTCWQLDPEERPSFGDLLETINFLLEKGTGDDNYIIAEDDEIEIIEEEEPPGSPKRKQSLIQRLNFENIDPSEISGSSESAFSGASKVSSGYSSSGYSSMPLSIVLEDENLTKETH